MTLHDIHDVIGIAMTAHLSGRRRLRYILETVDPDGYHFHASVCWLTDDGSYSTARCRTIPTAKPSQT